jgi:hypothetical protein
MLHAYHRCYEPIQCAADSDKVYLYPCRGNPDSAECLHFGMRKYRLSNSVYFDYCVSGVAQLHRSIIHHRAAKAKDTEGKQTVVHSSVQFNSLLPGEKQNRMSNLAKERTQYRQITLRLRNVLTKTKTKFKLSDYDSRFSSLITQASVTLGNLDKHERASATQHVIQ